MRRITLLAATTAIVAMLLAPTAANAAAGVNLQPDAGDNAFNGKVMGDDSPDCAAQYALESGLCEPGAPLLGAPITEKDFGPGNPPSASATSSPSASAAASASASPSASASASPSASASASAPAQDQYASPPAASALPDTGGSSVLLLSLVAIGVGLVIAGVVLRQVVRH